MASGAAGPQAPPNRKRGADDVNVLVTGASGFVGGATARRFADVHGVRVFGVGRRALERDAYARVDLAEPFDVPFRPDVVVHCAARTSPWGTRAEFERANVAATRNVVAFCERTGRPRLVYVSTSSVFYRNADQLALTEESPIGPHFVNAYAASKFAGERIADGYGGSSIVIRPRAVFGPGDTALFPRIVRAARAGRLPIVRRPGAPARSDLIYIDSLVDYLFAAARSTASGAFNVTNDEPVETMAFLLAILRRLDVPVPTRSVDVRVANGFAACAEALYRTFAPHREPPITRFGVSALAYSKTFDVAKARAAFGPPSVSLADGVKAFVDHERGRAKR
jgi:nucleoside-diphosphate-sugar epimerase